MPLTLCLTATVTHTHTHREREREKGGRDSGKEVNYHQSMCQNPTHGVIRVGVVQLPHHSCREETDVGLGRDVVGMKRSVPGHHHAPGCLPLSHRLQLHAAALLHLYGPAVGRRSAVKSRTTTLVVVVVVVVHHGESKRVHWGPLETTVVHGLVFGVNPRPLDPLIGETAGCGRGLVRVCGVREWRLEERLCRGSIAFSHERRHLHPESGRER